jgi:hypothetical protein
VPQLPAPTTAILNFFGLVSMLFVFITRTRLGPNRLKIDYCLLPEVALLDHLIIFKLIEILQ